ncbi:MAG: [protein-PII] uridylyltransferase [Alphaproteobacteria bacterium]
MKNKTEKLLTQLRKNKISGREFCTRHSHLMDTHIIKLAAQILTHDITLIATGGYGREELCPHSDIDILILTADKAPKSLNKDIEQFLYAIWDEGIKIGHAVRTINETLNITRQDAKTLTTLLDARCIAGNKELFEHLTTALQITRKPRSITPYITAKLEERDARHKRLGDSRYVLEPNIKDGKGSLRDYQTLFWITEMLHNAKTPAALKALKILTPRECRSVEKAHDFLLTVRCHLHDIANRPEERLHFDIQPRLAERLGYQARNQAKAVERFMKHYFLITRDIGDLTRIIIAAIETSEAEKAKLLPTRGRTIKGFEIIGKRLNFKPDQNLKNDPIQIIRFFRCAQDNTLDLHPAALQKIRRNLNLIDRNFREDSEANTLFLDILTAQNDAALTLRRMNEAGILGRFIPEFGKIIALMQFDRYHTFTVDEHTLRAIHLLHDIEHGSKKDIAPLTSILIHDIKNRRALYLATFLHDICKGRENKKKKGQDHSTLGAELALTLAPRLGLNDTETRLVSWLVFNHLFLSDIAFKRDLNDPKTIDDCLNRIPDMEHLKLLTILTTADIMAVGPDCWTAWKDSLLTDLYNKIETAFSGEKQTTTRPHTDSPTQTIQITQIIEKNATQITIHTNDKPALFTHLTAALAASDTNIIEARIETLDNGKIRDIFTVQNLSGLPITKPSRHTAITKNIKNALNANPPSPKTHNLSPKDAIFTIPTKIKTNNTASTDCTILEIATRDRPTLLHTIAKTLTNQTITIKSAKITTRGLKAIDTFYIQDKDHKKITDKAVIKTLKEHLLTALQSF